LHAVFVVHVPAYTVVLVSISCDSAICFDDRSSHDRRV